MARLKDWKVEELNSEQKKVHDDIVNGPRGKVVGPLRIWLNNPELAKCAQKVGAYARYKTSLDKSLSELAIITTGRVWSSEFEWEHHAPLAIEAGIKKRMAASNSEIIKMPAIAQFNQKCKIGRKEFLRGKLFYKNNTYYVKINGKPGAGVLTSLSGANGLIEVGENIDNDYQEYIIKKINLFFRK